MPKQSGVPERTIRVLVDKAREMMQNITVTTKFWAEALGTAVNVRILHRQKNWIGIYVRSNRLGNGK